MLAKILLTAVFVAIAVLWSAVGRQKLWLSLVGSPGVGMLLFMMILMLIPLDATLMNALICLLGGGIFGVGLGAVSCRLLNCLSLVSYLITQCARSLILMRLRASFFLHEKSAGAGPFSTNAPALRGCRSDLALLGDGGDNRDNHHHSNHHNGNNSRVHVHTLLLPKSPAKMLSSANGAIIAEDDVRPVAFAFAFHESLFVGKKGAAPPESGRAARV